MPSVAVPDVFRGTVTSSSATPDNVAVIVIAAPSSSKDVALEDKFTVGAVSSSSTVMLAEVLEPAAVAEPPLTEAMLMVAASSPS